MMLALRGVAFFLLKLVIAVPPVAHAGKSSHSYHPRSYVTPSRNHLHYHSSGRLKGFGYRSHVRNHSSHLATRLSYPYVTRDSHEHIRRNETAKREFMRRTGYPHGRPGYVVDHIMPLSKGGTDDPSNMQWQTKEEAKAKDRWERKR